MENEGGQFGMPGVPCSMYVSPYMHTCTHICIYLAMLIGFREHVDELGFMEHTLRLYVW